MTLMRIEEYRINLIAPEACNHAEQPKPVAKNDSVVFFPWLTEVRFFAAMLVFVQHTLNILAVDGLLVEKVSLVQTFGNHGVRLFFVLSGFLITSLLIKESARTGTIEIKKFYARRALRIWPLYYTLLVVAFLIPASWLIVRTDSDIAHLGSVKFEHFGTKLALFALMLPNLALTLFEPVAGFAQSWSIGVEEQFYLLWPALFKYLRNNTLVALGAVLLVKVILILGLEAYLRGTDTICGPITVECQNAKYLLKYLFFLQFEAMAIGGIGAIFFAKFPHQVTHVVKQHWFRALVLIGICASFSTNWLKIHELIGCDIVWICLLLSLTTSKLVLPISIGRPLNYLGKISYGIYMLHPLVDFLILKGLCLVTTNINNVYVFSYFVAALATTILTSALSYEFLERGFLRMKASHEVVKSSCQLPG